LESKILKKGVFSTKRSLSPIGKIPEFFRASSSALIGVEFFPIIGTLAILENVFNPVT
jgi:hypothetical protein